MTRFQPGRSGNPAGRPRGSASPESLAKNLIRPHISVIAERVLASALQGNPDACVAALSFYSSVRRGKAA